MTASVTHGRPLRYAEGSARGLLHHVLGHCLIITVLVVALLLFAAHTFNLLGLVRSVHGG